MFSKSAAHPPSRFTHASIALGVSEISPELSLFWTWHLFAQDNDAKFQDSYPYDKQSRTSLLQKKKNQTPLEKVHCWLLTQSLATELPVTWLSATQEAFLATSKCLRFNIVKSLWCLIFIAENFRPINSNIIGLLQTWSFKSKPSQLIYFAISVSTLKTKFVGEIFSCSSLNWGKIQSVGYMIIVQ